MLSFASQCWRIQEAINTIYFKINASLQHGIHLVLEHACIKALMGLESSHIATTTEGWDDQVTRTHKKTKSRIQDEELGGADDLHEPLGSNQLPSQGCGFVSFRTVNEDSLLRNKEEQMSEFQVMMARKFPSNPEEECIFRVKVTTWKNMFIKARP